MGPDEDFVSFTRARYAAVLARAGSNASNDKYVGFTVAGRYLVTLSLPAQERDQKNLTLLIAGPQRTCPNGCSPATSH